MDNAPGFITLKDDHVLKANGISLDLGNVKNINKNPVAERCNQELEKELLKIDPSGSPVTPLVLSTATDVLNSRTRHQGLSAKEIVFGRDQYTGNKLVVDGKEISDKQDKLRKTNHLPSAYSKSKSKQKAIDASVEVGDLVFIKSEGSKNNPRERYIIVSIKDRNAILQKMNTTKFCSKRYEVPLSKLYLAVEKIGECHTPHQTSHSDSDSTSEEDAQEYSSTEEEEIASESEDDEEMGAENGLDMGRARPARERREPAWMRDPQWVRD